jgi:hypothetical protein
MSNAINKNLKKKMMVEINIFCSFKHYNQNIQLS